MGAEDGASAVSFCKHKDLLFSEWKKEENPEAELGKSVGLQMQPAETL